MAGYTDYWPGWQRNRLNFILNHFSPAFFNGKTVLELGPYNGFFGASLIEFGANVVGIEGRHENIQRIKAQNPIYQTIIQHDLDSPLWPHGQFDVIINFGVLYHLRRFHTEFLQNCVCNCKLMFLESVIFDSPSPELYMRFEEGPDQSLSGAAGTPSASFVENILQETGAEFQRYDDPRLNAGHHYDWIAKNDRTFDHIARRFWIVKGCLE